MSAERRTRALRTPTVESPKSPGELQAELFAMLRRNADSDEFVRMRAMVEATLPDSPPRALLTSSIDAALAIRQEQILQQRRERGLLVVLETAHDLTAIRDLEMVLQAIVRRARQIFASDIGYLTNFDREQNDFYIRATDGALSEKFKRVRVPMDAGVCGHIVRTKTPYHSTGYQGDKGFVHDPIIDDAVNEEGVRSMLGAPLMVGTHVIGALFVCDREVRTYAQWEISMLSALAAQASVAIENARLFQEAQVALQRASEANQQLRSRAAETEQAAEAHENMIRLVASGGHVNDIVNVVAKLLHAEVALLDESERVVHCASDQNGERGHRLDGLLASPEVQQRVHRALHDSRTSGLSQAVPVAGLSRGEKVRVAAVNGADRLLGGLVILSQGEMSPPQVRTYERGALVTGVVLLSWERSERATSTEVAATIRALVSWHQENLTALQPRLERYGIDLSKPVRLLALHIQGRDLDYALRRARAPAKQRGVLMQEFDGLIVALASAEVFDAMQASVERVLGGDPNIELTGVASGIVYRPEDIPRSFQSLKRCLDVLFALHRRGRIVPEPELSLYALLFEQRQAGDIDAMVGMTIGKLIEHDARRKGDLCATLLAYLDHGHNARAAADALGIHVNTLRQRMETIESLMGEWQSSGRSLEVHMALRMHMLREKSALLASGK